MVNVSSRAGFALAGVAVCLCIGAAALRVAAQEKTAAGQDLLRVDWADPEIATFKASKEVFDDVPAGAANVRLPVMAFSGVPQLVKNVAGPDAVPVKPRTFVSDPKQPYWYHLTDTYDGVTVSVDADRRINVEADSKFQIGKGVVTGQQATAAQKGKPKISIADGAAEGAEGLVIEYVVQKFPDIPYTVTIECSTKAKSQCKDLAVISKDQGLLRVISVGKQ